MVHFNEPNRFAIFVFSTDQAGALMRFLRRLPTVFLLLLVIEFLDEFVYGAQEAAWPLIRSDLGLTYAQVGLLMSVPGMISVFFEPAIGILGDSRLRRALILGGGLTFAIALLLVGTSISFLMLLSALILFSPASGAFVSLSQAALMDADPARHEQNMARWTLAGSIGVVAGPLILTAVGEFGGSWRMVFLGFVALVAFAWRSTAIRYQPADNGQSAQEQGLWEGLRGALQALKRGEVLRWLILLEFSDLMLDVLYGYLALYFVDVAGMSPLGASAAVSVWTGVGLLGDFLLIPLLERVRGLTYLRISAWVELLLFPAFLLAPWLPVKLVLVGLLGFFNSGWYSILQGQLYSAMPGQSGAVMAVNNVSGLFGKLIPLAIGLAAESFGLGSAIWLLLAGPLALLVGLPPRSRHSDYYADREDHEA